MGHKTDPRRAVARQKKLSAADAAKLAAAHLKALDAGKRSYKKADELLDQLLAGVAVGHELTLADGRRATVVDNFAVKNKVFKPCGISRFGLDVKE